MTSSGFSVILYIMVGLLQLGNILSELLAVHPHKQDVDEMELGALSGDLDLLPDEVLSSVAARLGCSQPFERAVDAAIG